MENAPGCTLKQVKPRQFRRFHRRRLKKRRQYYWIYTPRYAGLYIDTPKPCSCPMCGNPRKWWNEVTRQEMKSNIDFRNQLDEIHTTENN